MEEVEPDLTNVITSRESTIEDQVTSEEPPPIEEKKPTPTPVEQAPQVATLVEKDSGAEQRGGEATSRRVYLGTLRKSLERHKVKPRSRLSGTVLLQFTVGSTGQLLSREVKSSSGSKALDDAAVAALDRAAPFPPMPEDLGQGPIEVEIPFKFIVR